LEQEFSLRDKVALVTGGNSGLGLETAMAFIEAGARAVYCADIAPVPGNEWKSVKDYVSRMKDKRGEGRLEYVSTDVRDQEAMWKLGETIGNREGRFDVCFTGAGITGAVATGLTVSADNLQEVLRVNLCGSVYTAQAAAQQMVRFKSGGSIILVSSVAGQVILRGVSGMPYELTKAGVLQMARSFACELAPQGIRVNSISPGLFKTKMIRIFYETYPELGRSIEASNPMGRSAVPQELRGLVTFLASDASSFCTGAK
ncbi:NAD-P-binding protein, partial [Trametes elegans]